MLARPHVLSWLLTLLWVETNAVFEEGEGWMLLWLPPLMLVWVNVHAGFVLGLALLGIFCIGRTWNALSAPRDGDRRKIAQLAAMLCTLPADHAANTVRLPVARSRVPIPVGQFSNEQH